MLGGHFELWATIILFVAYTQCKAKDLDVSSSEYYHLPEYATGYHNYEPRDYQFSYGVSDPHTGDHKSQWETRQKGVVRGSYSLLEPDGTTRIVEYIADDIHGFRAIVKRIGHGGFQSVESHGNEEPAPLIPLYQQPHLHSYDGRAENYFPNAHVQFATIPDEVHSASPINDDHHHHHVPIITEPEYHHLHQHVPLPHHQHHIAPILAPEPHHQVPIVHEHPHAPKVATVFQPEQQFFVTAAPPLSTVPKVITSSQINLGKNPIAYYGQDTTAEGRPFVPPLPHGSTVYNNEHFTSSLPQGNAVYNNHHFGVESVQAQQSLHHHHQQPQHHHFESEQLLYRPESYVGSSSPTSGSHSAGHAEIPLEFVQPQQFHGDQQFRFTLPPSLQQMLLPLLRKRNAKRSSSASPTQSKLFFPRNY